MRCQYWLINVSVKMPKIKSTAATDSYAAVQYSPTACSTYSWVPPVCNIRPMNDHHLQAETLNPPQHALPPLKALDFLTPESSVEHKFSTTRLASTEMRRSQCPSKNSSLNTAWHQCQGMRCSTKLQLVTYIHREPSTAA